MARNIQRSLLPWMMLPFCHLAFSDAASDYKEATSYLSSKHLNESITESMRLVSEMLPKADSSASLQSYGDNPGQMSLDGSAEIKDVDTAANSVSSTLSDSEMKSIAYANETGSNHELKTAFSTEQKETLNDVKEALVKAKSIQENPESQVASSDFFCSDGSCQKNTVERNTDFSDVITKLSAANAEANDVSSQSNAKNINSVRIFTGSVKRCSKLYLDTLDCCTDSGWAKGIFASCTDEEKELGAAKENGTALYVGRRSIKSWGVKTGNKSVYCVFPSRIAYDVQKDGRQNQLGRNFGSAKHPNCNGLTITDIKEIDLDKVDLSNVAGDTVSNTALPDNAHEASSLEQQLSAMKASESND